MTTTETKMIEEIADWSKPKRVETRNGPRNLRTAAPGDDFWKAWRVDKAILMNAGVSCSKRGGEWQACWWLLVDRLPLLRRS